jgi:hypothetical protein
MAGFWRNLCEISVERPVEFCVEFSVDSGLAVAKSMFLIRFCYKKSYGRESRCQVWGMRGASEIAGHVQKWQ